MLFSRSLNLAVLGFAILAGGCDRQSSGKAQPQASTSSVAGSEFTGTIDRSHKGTALPDFILTDATGQKLQLQSLKGKPLLVNLWATWCAPCVAELPLLDKLATARGDALKVLTVNQDMAKTDAISAFMQQRGITGLEPWLDPKNDLAFQFGAQTLPVTVYFDGQGREVWRFTGGHDWTSTETTALLTEAEGR